MIGDGHACAPAALLEELKRLRALPGILDAYIIGPNALGSVGQQPLPNTLADQAIRIAAAACLAQRDAERLDDLCVRIEFSRDRTKYIQLLRCHGYMICVVVQSSHPIGKSLKRTMLRVSARLLSRKMTNAMPIAACDPTDVLDTREGP